METLKNLFNKGPFTFVAGCLALVGLGIKIYFEKGITTEDFVIFMVGIGLIGSKDANKSHTKD